MNLLFQGDAGYRAADPYAGVRWSDELTPAETETIETLLAMINALTGAIKAVRALPPSPLTQTWIDTPADLAARLDDERASLHAIIADMQAGRAYEGME